MYVARHVALYVARHVALHVARHVARHVALHVARHFPCMLHGMLHDMLHGMAQKLHGMLHGMFHCMLQACWTAWHKNCTACCTACITACCTSCCTACCAACYTACCITNMSHKYVKSSCSVAAWFREQQDQISIYMSCKSSQNCICTSLCVCMRMLCPRVHVKAWLYVRYFKNKSEEIWGSISSFIGQVHLVGYSLKQVLIALLLSCYCEGGTIIVRYCVVGTVIALLFCDWDGYCLLIPCLGRLMTFISKRGPLLNVIWWITQYTQVYSRDYKPSISPSNTLPS